MNRIGIIALLMLVTAGVTSADYLTNGSFEDGTATSTYIIGDSSITGWSKSGSYGTNLALYHVNSNGGGRYQAAVAGNGAYYGAIGATYLGDGVYLSMEQELGTLEIGTTYTITGYANNDSDSVNCDWQIRIGSTVLGSGTQDHTWQSFSFDYTANATDGVTPTLYLGYLDTSADGTRSSALFDSVAVVPEPMTMSLMLVGGALAAIRRRKK